MGREPGESRLTPGRGEGGTPGSLRPAVPGAEPISCPCLGYVLLFLEDWLHGSCLV